MPLVITEAPPIDGAELRRGMTDASYPHPMMLALTYPRAAGRAWDRVVEDAVDEVLPAVERLLRDAIARRLPWSWPTPGAG